MCADKENEAKVGVAVVDRACRYISVNTTLSDFHGRKIHEYPQKHISELIPEQVFWVVGPLYSYVLRTGFPVELIELEAASGGCRSEVRRWQASYRPVREGVCATVRCLESSVDRCADIVARGSRTPVALSRCETAVMELLGEGKSSKEIAGRLHLSVFTIATHRKRICKKLNLHSSSELIAFATRL